jgi:hypothetical protein
MAPDLVVAVSSGGGSSGAARREWASHCCMPRGNGPVHLLG